MGLVFQFGANMSSKRLNAAKRLDGLAAPMGLAQTLDRFDLDFTCMSRQHACAIADLTFTESSSRGRRIYGVLFDIPDDRIFRSSHQNCMTLDEIEGEGISHVRAEIKVVLSDITAGYENKPITAIIYRAKKTEPFLKTELHYAMCLFEGLREFAAPEDYIDYLKFRIIRTNPKLASALDKF